ncbi:MAG: ABC transporter permease [Acidobacteriota bacterium]
MWRNHFKTAWRNMLRYRGYSIVTIVGLAVGMASAFLILLWIVQELSYDRFHANASNTYRVVVEDHRPDGIDVHPWLPFPTGRALAERFPEILAATRTASDDFMVRYKEHSHSELSFLFVDPGFFDIFSFPFARGTPAAALADPSSIVITDRMAAKYFGMEDPVGRVLNLSNRADFTVSAVVRIPSNSDFQYDFFLSFQSYPRFNADLAALESNWRANNYPTYVLLAEGCGPARVETKIAGLLDPYSPDMKRVLKLQPLAKVHLYNPDGTDGQVRYVRAFAVVAGLVLLIACINHMILASACFDRRAREVGLRKIAGGTGLQVSRQFLVESMLTTGVAFVLAMVLLEAVLPLAQGLWPNPIDLHRSDPRLIPGMLVIAFLAGTIAGSYPMVFFSRFPPVAVLQRSYRLGKGALLRKGLVVFQFSVSILLTVSTLVVFAQIDFIRHKDLGLSRENLVYAQMHGESRSRAEALKQELLKHPDILSATACRYLPSQIFVSTDSLSWEGKAPNEKLVVAYASVDCDYIPTFGMTITRGRNFSRDYSADADNFIINEEAARRMGFRDPIGQQLVYWDKPGTIVGVVKDFNHRPLTDPIRPLVLTPRAVGGSRQLLVAKLRLGDPEQALEHFRSAWQKINPGYSFEYTFYDEVFNRLYLKEMQLARVLLGFTVLAVFICALGLVGLSSYLASERTKEIGIRKALGASVGGIVALFSRDFAKWLALANAIALPLGFQLMSRWLQGYAYRTSISIWIFVVCVALSILIVLASASYQTFRAATASPVESIRHE